MGRTARVRLELVDRRRWARLGRAGTEQVVHVDVNGARRVGPRGADFRRLIVGLLLRVVLRRRDWLQEVHRGRLDTWL